MFLESLKSTNTKTIVLKIYMNKRRENIKKGKLKKLFVILVELKKTIFNKTPKNLISKS